MLIKTQHVWTLGASYPHCGLNLQHWVEHSMMAARLVPCPSGAELVGGSRVHTNQLRKAGRLFLLTSRFPSSSAGMRENIWYVKLEFFKRKLVPAVAWPSLRSSQTGLDECGLTQTFDAWLNLHRGLFSWSFHNYTDAANNCGNYWIPCDVLYEVIFCGSHSWVNSSKPLNKQETQTWQQDK